MIVPNTCGRFAPPQCHWARYAYDSSFPGKTTKTSQKNLQQNRFENLVISRQIAVVVFAWVKNFHAGREGIGGEAVGRRFVT
jgi:hypothetical protein